MTTPIKVGTYKTRDGRKAEVLATGAPGEYPLMGYVVYPQGTAEPTSWRKNGTYFNDTDNGADLVAEWREPRTETRDVYACLWTDGSVSVSTSPAPSIYWAGDERVIGATKVTVTVTEGDGAEF